MDHKEIVVEPQNAEQTPAQKSDPELPDSKPYTEKSPVRYSGGPCDRYICSFGRIV